MVIPASMNQIHGGVQLIRLVLTSISTLMIKTLQTLSPSIHQAGGPPSPQARAHPAVGPGCPQTMTGSSLVASSVVTALHLQAWQTPLPPATTPELLHSFTSILAGTRRWHRALQQWGWQCRERWEPRLPALQ